MITTDRIEKLMQDLRFQLTFYPIDWDYFLDTVQEVQDLERKQQEESEQSL